MQTCNDRNLTILVLAYRNKSSRSIPERNNEETSENSSQECLIRIVDNYQKLLFEVVQQTQSVVLLQWCYYGITD